MGFGFARMPRASDAGSPRVRATRSAQYASPWSPTDFGSLSYIFWSAIAPSWRFAGSVEASHDRASSAEGDRQAATKTNMSITRRMVISAFELGLSRIAGLERQDTSVLSCPRRGSTGAAHGVRGASRSLVDSRQPCIP